MRAIIVLAVAVGLGVPAVPAQAHGAMQTPLSRAAACGRESPGTASSPACKAAVAAGNRADWDNIRVADVDGRDRDRIPDGKLCSAGNAAYRGLDLPRADWPATTLTAGSTFTFRYRETIAHEGGFRLFLTRQGYDPAKPLRWADLETTPFLTVPAATRRDGAYTFTGRIPAGRTGRHLIYTIWQNSNTPDTYYSCSDVDLASPTQLSSPPAAPPRSSAPAAAAPSSPASEASPASPASPATTPAAGARDLTGGTLPYAAGAILLAVVAAFTTTLLRRRRR